MNDIDNARVNAAIAQQDSPHHVTPSGAILTLLTEFACEGKFSEMAEAFTRFRLVHGANAGFVQEAVPAKILNWFFAKDGAIDFSTFDTWTKSSERKDWAAQIKQAIASPPTFESVVKTMREELVAIEKKRAA